MQVVLKGKALPGGNLIAKGEWSMVNLLVSSPPLPTTWLGVHAVSVKLQLGFAESHTDSRVAC